MKSNIGNNNEIHPVREFSFSQFNREEYRNYCQNVSNISTVND